MHTPTVSSLCSGCRLRHTFSADIYASLRPALPCCRGNEHFVFSRLSIVIQPHFTPSSCFSHVMTCVISGAFQPPPLLLSACGFLFAARGFYYCRTIVPIMESSSENRKPTAVLSSMAIHPRQRSRFSTILPRLCGYPHVQVCFVSLFAAFAAVQSTFCGSFYCVV